MSSGNSMPPALGSFGLLYRSPTNLWTKHFQPR